MNQLESEILSFVGSNPRVAVAAAKLAELNAEAVSRLSSGKLSLGMVDSWTVLGLLGGIGIGVGVGAFHKGERVVSWALGAGVATTATVACLEYLADGIVNFSRFMEALQYGVKALGVGALIGSIHNIVSNDEVTVEALKITVPLGVGAGVA